MNQKENEATSIMMHFFLTGLTLNFEADSNALEIFLYPTIHFSCRKKGPSPNYSSEGGFATPMGLCFCFFKKSTAIIADIKQLTPIKMSAILTKYPYVR